MAELTDTVKYSTLVHLKPRLTTPNLTPALPNTSSIVLRPAYHIPRRGREVDACVPDFGGRGNEHILGVL
jgi:hypothetical protein